MDPGRFGEETLGSSSHIPVTSGKSIKKKKSLPRLFLLSRKKSFKSSPPSPVSSDTSAPSPSSSHALPSSSSSTIQSVFAKRKGELDCRRDGILKEATGNTGKALHRSAQNTAAADFEISPKEPFDSMHHDENSVTDPIRVSKTRSRKVSGSSGVSLERLSKKRSEGGLRMHPVVNITSRNRGASTSHYSPPLFSNTSLPPRPFTAITAEFQESRKDTSDHIPMQIDSARRKDREGRMYQKPTAIDGQIQWQSLFGNEETRHSSRSGMSTASSHPDTGSTEQSSIFTKMSSVSDMTIDLDEDTDANRASMTVDDAIELYSAGFDDDFGLKTGDPMRPTSSDEVRRRSHKIAEAMNEPINSVTLPQPPPMSPESRSSTAIMTGEVFRSIFPKPPSIQVPTATHDQYGFRKSSRDISTAQHDTWYAEYAGNQDRRTSKWNVLLRDHGLSIQNPTRFPARSAKVQRYIRKGVPPAWRGEVWFFYAGGAAYLRKHPDLYAELILRSQTPKLSMADREAIERDLNRTFPDCIHFKPDPPLTPTTETPLLSSLRRVLSAFAVYHPRIGYCQSLNFITGLLLLFLPEEKAFWMLHIITTLYLPGTHEVSLEGANVDLWVLMLALKESLPGIWAKVGGEVNANTTRLPPISLCTTSWFMSLYIGTLPVESVLRVWDVLFYEGSRTLFRIALAIFKLGESEIKNVSDPMEIFQVVQGLPRKMQAIGPLLDVACNRGAVNINWVERKRAERKGWYAKERAVEQVRKASRDVGRKASRSDETVDAGNTDVEMGNTEALPDPSRFRGRADTGWRTKFGLGKRID